MKGLLNYLNSLFTGRIGVLNFWLGLISVLLIGYAEAMVLSKNSVGQFLEIIIGLFLCIIFLSLFIRRIHDHNKAGWYCLLSYVPIFGIYVLFLLCYMPGKKQANKFGHGISGLSLKAIFAPGMLSHKE